MSLATSFLPVLPATDADAFNDLWPKHRLALVVAGQSLGLLERAEGLGVPGEKGLGNGDEMDALAVHPGGQTCGIREGFPVPEPEVVLADITPQSWTAGRSFAPRKDPHEVGQLQKLGIEFHWNLGTVLLWMILIPGGAVGLFFFVKWLLAMLHAGGLASPE